MSPTHPQITESREYELFCHGKLSDPYPLLRRLRQEDPVHWSPVLRSWLVTRYDDAVAGLLNRDFASDRVSAYMDVLSEEDRLRYRDLGEHVSNWLGFTDPPKHTRMRTLIRKVFTPAQAEDFRSRVEVIVDGLIDRFERRGEADLVAEFAFQLPATVICEILGVPIDRAEDFQRWSNDMAAFTGHIGPSLADIAARAHASQTELYAFFDELIAARKRTPRADLLTALATVEEDGERLSRTELIGLSVFLLVAGHETTVSLISSGLFLLMTHPEALGRVRAEPALMDSAVEEFLRFEAPIQFTPRLVTTDVELRGRTIGAGDTVVLHNAAANRDPDRFERPDVLDVERPNNRHLAFGWGAHFCLGAPLARVEATSAISRFLERTTDVRLLCERPAWRENMTLRGLTELPVAFSSSR